MYEKFRNHIKWIKNSWTTLDIELKLKDHNELKNQVALRFTHMFVM